MDFDAIKRRIARLLHFGFSSVWTQFVDIAVFSAVCVPLEPVYGRAAAIFAAVPAAKLASGHCCFFYNLRFVFKDRFSWRAYFSFWALVAWNTVILIGCTQVFSTIFDASGMWISVVNFLATVALWFCSFLVQEFVVFKSHQ